MTLCINPYADPYVEIPIVPDRTIRVSVLRDVDHRVLAKSVGLTLEQFESRIREWDQGIGLPYGVLVKSDDLKTHNYKTVNASLHQSVEEAMNAWAKQGWRVVSVNIDTRPGYADQIFLERPGRVWHLDD